MSLLPLELRTIIWELVLIRDAPITLSPQIEAVEAEACSAVTWMRSSRTKRKISINAIAYTCRTCYRECNPIFYRNNKFRAASTSVLQAFFHDVQPVHIQSITSLEIFGEEDIDDKKPRLNPYRLSRIKELTSLKILRLRKIDVVIFGDVHSSRPFTPIHYLELLADVVGGFESLETVEIKTVVHPMGEVPEKCEMTRVSCFEVAVSWVWGEESRFLTVTELLQKKYENRSEVKNWGREGRVGVLFMR